MKQCSKCLLQKAYSDFYKNAKTKDNYCSKCKSCVKEDTKIWKQNNPEKVNAQNRRWNKKNPDKALEITRKYRAKNPEVVSDNNHRRRDLKINNGSFKIRKLFMRRLYDSPCIFCGSLVNIQADHVIPLSRGGRHSEGNLAPLCQNCNLDKRDKTNMEWRISK